jgi:hypothetical protein
VALCVAASVFADPAEPQPIDQAVGDADKLATSLRRVDVGLRSDGEQTSLFRVQPSQYLPQTFLRVAPGLRARVERVDYLIRTGKKTFEMNISPRRDGQFLELVPANTVFDLRPVERAIPSTPLAPDDESPAVNAVVDSRVDGAIDGQVSNRVEPVRVTPEPLD